MNPAIKEFKDPLNGETLLAIPAVNIDIAFLHAATSDPYGHVQYIGHGYGDRAIYAAANAGLQQNALILGEPEFLAPEEAVKAAESNDKSLDRAWNLWAREATREIGRAHV